MVQITLNWLRSQRTEGTIKPVARRLLNILSAACLLGCFSGVAMGDAVNPTTFVVVDAMKGGYRSYREIGSVIGFTSAQMQIVTSGSCEKLFLVNTENTFVKNTEGSLLRIEALKTDGTKMVVEQDDDDNCHTWVLSIRKAEAEKEMPRSRLSLKEIPVSEFISRKERAVLNAERRLRQRAFEGEN